VLPVFNRTSRNGRRREALNVGQLLEHCSFHENDLAHHVGLIRMANLISWDMISIRGLGKLHEVVAICDLKPETCQDPTRLGLSNESLLLLGIGLLGFVPLRRYRQI
jgi:hypothetical protein